MSDLILIRATTTSKFFGEPMFLGEVLKDLTSQALRLDRHGLKFEHRRTDEADAPAIQVFVDTLGDDAIAEQLIAALGNQFEHGGTRSSMQFAVEFSGQLESGLFTLQGTPLIVPSNDVIESAHYGSSGSEFHSYEDMMGEISERRRRSFGW